VLAWALVNNFKSHDSRRCLPPGADVDIDLRRLFFGGNPHIIPVLDLDLLRLGMEDCINGHTFA
jgi:hypothetical protein